MAILTTSLFFDLSTSLSGMAPKQKLTAALFHERYGELVSEHFAQYTTAHTLRIALAKRVPPIIVTDSVLKMWYHGFHSASRPPESNKNCITFLCLYFCTQSLGTILHEFYNASHEFFFFF